VLCLIVADKQQELDIPSLRIEETANDGRGTAVTGGANSAAGKKNKDRGRHGSGTMSQIQGVKRPLYHTNSFTGEKLPKFGVETPHEEELERVSFLLIQPGLDTRFLLQKCWRISGIFDEILIERITNFIKLLSPFSPTTLLYFCYLNFSNLTFLVSLMVVAHLTDAFGLIL
jgi:hypothetical protein